MHDLTVLRSSQDVFEEIETQLLRQMTAQALFQMSEEDQVSSVQFEENLP